MNVKGKRILVTKADVIATGVAKKNVVPTGLNMMGIPGKAAKR